MVQLGPKIILSKSSDGATPLHIAAGIYTSLVLYLKSVYAIHICKCQTRILIIYINIIIC